MLISQLVIVIRVSRSYMYALPDVSFFSDLFDEVFILIYLRLCAPA